MRGLMQKAISDDSTCGPRASLVAAVTVPMLLWSIAAGAAELHAEVFDAAGAPVADAVISLTPPAAGAVAAPATQLPAVMDQWAKQYTPYVLPVQVGSRVLFPNRDNIKHHVYSFSPAKRFELKLYSYGTAQPVLFDKVGIVALGCNIHDWMQAYIDVLPTPYFARSDAQGHAQVTGVPAGHYRVDVWHPRLRGDATQFAQQATLTATQDANVKFALPLKRDQRRRPPRYFEGGDY